MKKGRKQVIAVMHSDASREALCAELENEYAIVLLGENEQALEMLRAPDSTIRAVILDADDNGLLDEMQMDTRLRELPVIVVAANGNVEEEVRLLGMGANEYISLPCDPRVFRLRIHHAICLCEATRDRLTGIHSKEVFYQKTYEMLIAHPEQTYTIISVDIERFKIINDLFGEKAGNDLLRFLGGEMRYYAGDTGTAGRVGADIFGLCLPMDVAGAEEVAQKLENAMKRYPLSFEIVLAVGFYPVDDRELSVGLMCDRAGMALSTVKGNYMEHFAVYDEAMREALVSEQEIVNEMDTALQEGQFTIYLQAQYDILTDAVIGAEALVRWIHPRKGMIAPVNFISLFEHNGFIMKLDAYIWEQACILLRQWIDNDQPVLPISVNVSRINLYNPNLCQLLINLVERYHISPELLKLEITESAYTENSEQLLEVMKTLQDYGFVILMDDFGSGYSSLNMLKDVPVDILKIDINFQSGGKSASRGCNILTSIVRMAKWLGLPVIAEGVETEEEVDFLRSIGCGCVQGYYYSRPVPVETYERMLMSAALQPMHRERSLEGINLEEFWKPDSQVTLLFNSVIGGLGIYELNYDILEVMRVNDGYYDIMGMTASNPVLNVLSYVQEQDRLLVLDSLQKAARTRLPMDFCCRRYRADGKLLWLQCRARFLAGTVQHSNFYIACVELPERSLHAPMGEYSCAADYGA